MADSRYHLRQASMLTMYARLTRNPERGEVSSQNVPPDLSVVALGTKKHSGFNPQT
jgi:hypothetical protein